MTEKKGAQGQRKMVRRNREKRGALILDIARVQCYNMNVI